LIFHDLVVLLNLALADGFHGLSPHDIQPLIRYTIEARYPYEPPLSIDPL
jgi:hypothetical protein